MSKKKRRRGASTERRQSRQHSTNEPEYWEAYLDDPIALMQDGEYHLLHAWELRNEDPLYGEDPVDLKRRQAAIWEHDRNDNGGVRYPDDYKAQDEEPDELDGDDRWSLGYRAGYVLESWGPEEEYVYDYDDDDDWEGEDIPF